MILVVAAEEPFIFVLLGAMICQHGQRRFRHYEMSRLLRLGALNPKLAATKPTKAARKEAAKDASPRAASKDAVAPREGSKGGQILGLLERKSGATLGELMATTGWQRHSVRGWLSTARKRLGLKIQATRKDGVTTYRIV